VSIFDSFGHFFHFGFMLCERYGELGHQTWRDDISRPALLSARNDELKASSCRGRKVCIFGSFGHFFHFGRMLCESYGELGHQTWRDHRSRQALLTVRNDELKGSPCGRPKGRKMSIFVLLGNFLHFDALV
jgi:hypothetical protein